MEGDQGMKSAIQNIKTQNITTIITVLVLVISRSITMALVLATALIT